MGGVDRYHLSTSSIIPMTCRSRSIFVAISSAKMLRRVGLLRCSTGSSFRYGRRLSSKHESVASLKVGTECGRKNKVIIMGDVKVFVDQKIAGKKVMVFSKSSCPFCSKAKAVFAKYLGNLLSEEDYEVLEIENRSDCAAIQDYLLTVTKGRSVPRVFINQKFIGGGDDVVAKDKSGELKALLA